MYFKATIFIVLVAIYQTQSKELDPGPQPIKDTKSSSAAASQTTQKRYATKEVILYLTPSQIKALQAGQGLVNPQSLPESPETAQNKESDLSLREHDAILREQFENIKSARITPVEEPQVEQNPVNLENAWNQEQAKLEEELRSRLYSNRWNAQQANLLKENEPQLQRNVWLPYGSILEKKEEERLLQEQFKQQWNRILEQNRAQLRGLQTLESENQKTEAALIQVEKPLLQLQYAPKYNDQRNAIEIEKKIRQNHREDLEKQSALVQAEAIANSPPLIVHHEIRVVKHRPVPVVKHVKVPVPTPVLVPVPQPYEVKVPDPYPVPLEIVKNIPVPVIQGQRNEAEQRIPVRPYFVRNPVPGGIRTEVPADIPLHKAERVTILRQIWKH